MPADLCAMAPKQKATAPPEDGPAAKRSGGFRAAAGRKAPQLGLGASKTKGTQPSLAALIGARAAPSRESAPAGAPAAAAGAGAQVRPFPV